jgi:hypothetical protein
MNNDNQKLRVNDKVAHDYSRTIGVIKAIKQTGKYRYFVYWDNEQNGDWYERKVLIKL